MGEELYPRSQHSEVSRNWSILKNETLLSLPNDWEMITSVSTCLK